MNKCPLPWMGIETTPLGEARPCCLSEIPIPNIDLRKNTLTEAFNSEYMRNLRQRFRDGEKPWECKKCWIEEDAGKTSKREFMRAKYRDIDYDSEGGLSFLDLKLGNVCNLKCRICGAWSSSKWAQEEKVNGNEHATTWLKQGNWPRDNERFWEDLDRILPDVRYFEFTGGEPFLIQEHFDLLSRASEKGFAPHIDIHYNTNGTTFPVNHTVWKNYKHVEVAFSIDNVRDRFEYERFPARWNTVQENIKKMKDLPYNMSFQLCVTWNIQNIYYIEEILEWAESMQFDSIHFNMVYSPWFFSLRSIPAQAKPAILEKLDQCTKYRDQVQHLKRVIEQSTHDTNGALIREVLGKSDRYRRQDFRHSHPEIAELIGYGQQSN